MKTLESRMKIYFRLFTLIGQFPFKITEKGLIPSNVLKLFAIIPIIALATAIAVLARSGELSFLNARAGILRLAFFGLGICLMAATVIVPIWKSSLYCSVFQRFNRVEGHFGYLGIAIKEGKNIFPPFLILFQHFIFLGIIVISDYVFPYWVTMNLPIFGLIFYWTVVFIMTFVTINCRTYAHLINTRFDAINDELEKMDETFKSNKIFSMDNIFGSHLINDLYRNNKNIKISPTSENRTYRHMNLKKTNDIPANVRILEKSHYELYGICATISGLFTYPVVLTIFFTGCEILFTCYTGIGKILNDNGDLDLLQVSTWLKYIIYDLVRVVSICKTFTSIEKSGNRTSFTVHGLILKMEDSNLQKELIKFSQQLLHHKISFSTCGFFRLDMSLLVSMTGAITTYLVILLQFSTSKPECGATVSSQDKLPVGNYDGNFSVF